MSNPKPPFHSRVEELLYNIYLKINSGDVSVIENAINNLKGNVPPSGDTLEKLYNIIQGLHYLTAQDIDTLSELNNIIENADLVSLSSLNTVVGQIRGNVPVVGNSLEKLYNIIQGLTALKQEDIDTLEELNAILTDADLVRTTDLTNAIASLNLTKRSLQFYFASDQEEQHNRDRFVLRGRITSLSQDFTDEIYSVTYKSRLDTSGSWVSHSDLLTLQTWINNNITGNEVTGTKYWIRCIMEYKEGHNDEAMNILSFSIA